MRAFNMMAISFALVQPLQSAAMAGTIGELDPARSILTLDKQTAPKISAYLGGLSTEQQDNFRTFFKTVAANALEDYRPSSDVLALFEGYSFDQTEADLLITPRIDVSPFFQVDVSGVIGGRFYHQSNRPLSEHCPDRRGEQVAAKSWFECHAGVDLDLTKVGTSVLVQRLSGKAVHRVNTDQQIVRITGLERASLKIENNTTIVECSYRAKTVIDANRFQAYQYCSQNFSYETGIETAINEALVTAIFAFESSNPDANP